MKKIFAVALIFILAMTMFCACAETLTFKFKEATTEEQQPVEAKNTKYAGCVATIDTEAKQVVYVFPDHTETEKLTALTEGDNVIYMITETEQGVSVNHVLGKVEGEITMVYLEDDAYIWFTME